MPELASRTWEADSVHSMGEAAFAGGDGAEMAGPFIAISRKQ
jgi:hypothetical protein